MDSGYKLGLMEQLTRAIGGVENSTVKAFLLIQTVIVTRDSFTQTKPTAWISTNTKMVSAMRVCGKMTSTMATALNYYVMDRYTRAASKMVYAKAMESILRPRENSTRVNGTKIVSRGKESFYGLTADPTKDNGNKICSTAAGNTDGLMEKFI